MKLSAIAVKKLEPREKSFTIHDGGGLYLRVLPGGTKSWLYMYTIAGRKRWYGLGTWPDVSLADARGKLSEARKLVKAGKDPAQVDQEQRHKENAEPIVSEVVSEFLTRHVKEKAPRSHAEYKRNLEKDVIKAWGTRKVKDITRRDVNSLLESIVDRGAKNQANQVFKIVRAMFNWAVPRYDLEYSPCSNVKLPTAENKKERFFTEDEIRAFWKELDTSGMTEEMKRAFRLILATGQRPGEVIGAHSREIDGNWWTIPPERAKNKREHRVFLSPLARELFGTFEGFRFPSPRPILRGGKSIQKPIEVNALAHAVRRNSSWAQKPEPKKKKKSVENEPFFFTIKEPWTPHDLRRTCATHLGEMGYSDEVIGRVLNHTRAGVTSRYNRHQYDKEIETALCAWARKLGNIITGQKPDNVVPLHKGAGGK
ncbi:MAG: tyrosine-type recombinase/integrase [Trichloromonadaceae bacterium]